MGLDLTLSAEAKSGEDKATLKKARAALHQCIRTHFAGALSSESHPDCAAKVRVWDCDKERKAKQLPTGMAQQKGSEKGQDKGKGKGKKSKGKGKHDKKREAVAC